VLASLPVCVAQMPPIMQAVVHVESSYNPYAIGVVHGRLVRQPHNAAEAVATAEYLSSMGRNFSLGIAQVNRYNLARYGLNYQRHLSHVVMWPLAMQS
jgi:type IV secretion system protein VirB1